LLPVSLLHGENLKRKFCEQVGFFRRANKPVYGEKEVIITFYSKLDFLQREIKEVQAATKRPDLFVSRTGKRRNRSSRSKLFDSQERKLQVPDAGRYNPHIEAVKSRRNLAPIPGTKTQTVPRLQKNAIAECL